MFFYCVWYNLTDSNTSCRRIIQTEKATGSWVGLQPLIEALKAVDTRITESSLKIVQWKSWLSDDDIEFLDISETLKPAMTRLTAQLLQQLEGNSAQLSVDFTSEEKPAAEALQAQFRKQQWQATIEESGSNSRFVLNA
ncbi:MAG: hypothetical protein K2W82_15800 [Candidatus Obscuribacterales bacterium]|jgi:hypothetical protein|nr:hypothetical protein [Candidatus Obscuribacterales bacterium]